MTWEPAPESSGARRWMWPAVVLVVVAVVAAILLTRAEGSGTLTIGPTARSTGRATPSADPSDFAPAPLGALEAATEVVGDGPLLPDAPDLTLVTTDDVGLHTIDLATGDIRHTALLTDAPYAIDPWTLITVGDHIISNAGDDVVGMTGPDRQIVRLVRHHSALPTVDDTAIWVLENQPQTGLSTVVRVGLDGTITDRIGLPLVAQPLAGTAAGMLVSTPSGIHLASGDDVRRITASGQLTAVGPDRLAWLDCAADLSCHIAIGTFDDPDQVRVPLARTEMPGGFGLALGRFSPDGRRLALPILRFDAGPETAQTVIAIIDTVTGAEAPRIPAPRSQAFDSTPLEWSPDGRLLFVGLGTNLSAWKTDTGELIQLNVGRQQIRGLAISRD